MRFFAEACDRLEVGFLCTNFKFHTARSLGGVCGKSYLQEMSTYRIITCRNGEIIAGGNIT